MDDIRERLERLEAALEKSRRHNRLFVLAVFAFACMAGAQKQGAIAPPPNAGQKALPQDGSGEPTEPAAVPPLTSVSAHEFVLVDRNGHSLAKLSSTDGRTEFCMLDAEGRKRLELSQSSSASGVSLYDDAGAAVVSLSLPAEPNVSNPARLEIKEDRGRSQFQANGISIFDSADRGRLFLSLINEGFAALGISSSNQDGPPSIEFVATEGSRGVKVHNQSGFPTFTLHADEDDSTTLMLRHPGHEKSLQFDVGSQDQDNPSITFFGPASPGPLDGGLLPWLKLGLQSNGQPSIRMVDSSGTPVFSIAPH